MDRTALIAIGGNALIRANERGTADEQLRNARQTSRGIVEIVKEGWQVAVTHGNGPQVGAALLRSERGRHEVYEQSLNLCVAATEGEIGHLLQQSLHEELAAHGLGLSVVTVLSQVIVLADDPELSNPTKPIGPFYSRPEAEDRRSRLGWTMVQDAAHGYRRVVPSPEPVEILGENVVRLLLEAGVLVIALGGGGIPVVRDGHRLIGVDAVIDKDRASALLACHLNVDLFVIATDVDRIYLDFAKQTQRPLDWVTADELEHYHAAAQFPPGTMGPKVEAALRFLRHGGREVIVTSYDCLAEAVSGRAGSHIVSSAPANGGSRAVLTASSRR